MVVNFGLLQHPISFCESQLRDISSEINLFTLFFRFFIVQRKYGVCLGWAPTHFCVLHRQKRELVYNVLEVQVVAVLIPLIMARLGIAVVSLSGPTQMDLQRSLTIGKGKLGPIATVFISVSLTLDPVVGKNSLPRDTWQQAQGGG